MFTNSGTWTVAPVSSVAGLLPPPDAVSPRTPGLGLRDLELDARGQLQVARLPVDEQQDRPRRWASSSAARPPPADSGTASCSKEPGVHEVRVGPVGVEELHLARLGAHRTELLAGAERAVDHVAVGRAAQLRAHERAALAGLDVLELEDLEDRALDLDVVARS
jgi:hypothetical protein